MSSERAKNHVKHKGYCTCGKVVSGNGAIYQHREMHKRRRQWCDPMLIDGGGFYYMTYSAWTARKAA